MRHTPKELGDHLLDREYLDFYTSIQKRGRLDGYSHVMAFVRAGSGKTIFRGLYEIQGKQCLDAAHFSHLYLPDKLISHYDQLAAGKQYDYYTISKSSVLSEYDGRLVIDWGDAKIVWLQKYSDAKPKEVIEILPSGFFKAFDEYASVSITRSELEYLVSNEESNPEWVSHLSKVSGVYLILDEGTGQQYIGSATGSSGLWGRWKSYALNPSGGNVRLAARLEQDPTAYRRFRYSVLEVIVGNPQRDDILAKESLYKTKLGTRVFGLNDN